MLLDDDRELVRRETGVRGLATVLDPDAFRDALAEALPDARLGGARAVYLRYKPATSCLVAYEIDVAGEPVRVYARAHGRDVDVKVRKAASRPGAPGPLGAGRLELPGRDVVVFVFPNDAEVRALERLADPDWRDRLRASLFPDRTGPGALETLAYKPERRYVAHWSVDGGAAALKLYTRAGFAVAESNARAFSTESPLRVPRLLGASEQRLLAFEWLPGVSLRQRIAALRFDHAAVEATGEALARLHAQSGDGLVAVTREGEAGELAAVAEWLAAVAPGLADRSRELSRHVGERLAGREPVAVPIHGDFYAEQVLVGDDVAIVDLDRAKLGDPAADLGLFVAHLERDAMRGALAADRVEAASAALLAGYAKAHSLPDGLDLYTAAGLVRLSPEPFRWRVPGWLGATEAILARAEAILRAPARSGGMAR